MSGNKVFPNLGKTWVEGDESFWGPQADIWTPPVDLDRRDIHLADWDADGDCDIIWVNPENGNVRVWVNSYNTTQTWEDAFAEMEAPTLTCGEKRGIGIDDRELKPRQTHHLAFPSLTRSGGRHSGCAFRRSHG